MPKLVGIFGQPYLNLDDVIGTDALPALDREITRGLVHVEPGQTGGSLKSMGICAPVHDDDGYVDYGDVIAGFTFAEWQELVSLADAPSAFDPARWRETRFGDETDHPLNRAQIRWLTYRYGVYFPWKVCVHLKENHLWEDKHHGAGKDFSDEARERFPETVRFVEALPFAETGRVVLFGLMPNDHAPAHRDSEPGKSLGIAQSISIDPRGTKRFFLTDREGADDVEVESHLYWFNDMDHHGVKADPFFRYSVRVDGVFQPSFVRDLERRFRQR
jgi:hypothetical protein